jgi:hypothetical protein
MYINVFHVMGVAANISGCWNCQRVVATAPKSTFFRKGGGLATG